MRAWLADRQHMFPGLIRVAGASSVLLVAVLIGGRASTRWLMLVLGVTGATLLLWQPTLALLAIVPMALVVPINIGTGTEVMLNGVTVLVAVLFGAWIGDMLFRRKFEVVSCRVNTPLMLFLIAGLLSLVVGTVLWDPSIPRPNGFVLVQLAQWGIFALSAAAFWMCGNQIKDADWLRALTWLFLGVGGVLAIVVVVLGSPNLVAAGVTTMAVARAPFWMLLCAMAGGQLLFNDELTMPSRFYLGAVLLSILIFVFHFVRRTASYWVSVSAVLGILCWLRWPRLRWVVVLGVLGLVIAGILPSALFSFAGGNEEWLESGGSRLALIRRVIEVTLRNPVTGLGPAAYRVYARARPMRYLGALWWVPNVSSHNNYVDLFSHVGLLGLGLFLWFAVELLWLAWRTITVCNRGFDRGYATGVFSAWVASLVVMALVDMILPFVYNVGFPGFQASVLVWLFAGGLLSLRSQIDLGEKEG